MKEIKEEIEFLEYIYQSAKLSQESLGRINRIKELNENTKAIIVDMLSGYKKIALSAKKMLARRNKEAIDIGVLSKMATYMNVKLNFANIENEMDVAQVIIQSCHVNTDQITEKLNEIKITNKTVLNLAERYMALENDSIERLKNILVYVS